MLQLQWFCRVNFQLHNHMDLFLMQQKIAWVGWLSGVALLQRCGGFPSIHKAWFLFQSFPEVLVPTPLKRSPMSLRNRTVVEPSFNITCYLWVCLVLSVHMRVAFPRQGFMYSTSWSVTYHVSGDGLGPLILLPLPPRCQDYRPTPQGLVYEMLEIKLRALWMLGEHSNELHPPVSEWDFLMRPSHVWSLTWGTPGDKGRL